MLLKLIELLSCGQFHSGEELGEKLGVSRAAIWKQLQKLAELGLVVESVRGKGYCLIDKIELFDEAAIREGLTIEAAKLLSQLNLFSIIDSTNAEALREVPSNKINGCAYLAEYQTAGKGRRGRSWVSPYGQNLYMSVSWVFDGGVGSIQGLSLALGVAASEAISQLGVEGIQLKWPNDLLYNKKKVGGILVEVEGDPAGECRLAIGVGINTSASSGMAAIDQPWTDLSTIKGQEVSRNQLAANILSHWLPLLSDYALTGFSCFREKWLSMDCYANKSVRLIMGAKEVSGIARGVDNDGSLLLEVDGCLQSYFGGEVSLRAAVCSD